MESLISVFQEFITSINKIFILTGRLGASRLVTGEATRMYHVYK